MMTQNNSKERIVYAHENCIVDALEDRIVYALEIVYFTFMTLEIGKDLDIFYALKDRRLSIMERILSIIGRILFVDDRIVNAEDRILYAKDRIFYARTWIKARNMP